MQVVFHDTRQTEKLSGAVLVYESFATMHSIEHREAGPVIVPGVLATKEALVCALRNLLPESDASTGLIPEVLLAKGVDHMVWWIKPQMRSVRFACTEFGSRCDIVPNPGLVMVASQKGWYVFAVKCKGRPTPSTKLYQAPYFNVWKSGQICTGNVTLPSGADWVKTDLWEEAFFGSAFSHPNVHSPDKLVKAGAYAFWRDMLDGKYGRKFPTPLLVDRKMTLESMYRQVLQGDDDA